MLWSVLYLLLQGIQDEVFFIVVDIGIGIVNPITQSCCNLIAEEIDALLTTVLKLYYKGVPFGDVSLFVIIPTWFGVISSEQFLGILCIIKYKVVQLYPYTILGCINRSLKCHINISEIYSYNVCKNGARLFWIIGFDDI